MDNQALQQIKENIIADLAPYLLNDDENLSNEIEDALDKHLNQSALKDVIEIGDFDDLEVVDYVDSRIPDMEEGLYEKLKSHFDIDYSNADVEIDTGRDTIYIKLDQGNLLDLQLCQEFAEKMNVTNHNQLILL